MWRGLSLLGEEKALLTLDANDREGEYLVGDFLVLDESWECEWRTVAMAQCRDDGIGGGELSVCISTTEWPHVQDGSVPAMEEVAKE